MFPRCYPAIRQKVAALVGRSVVQARDVFDLALLFAATGGSVEALRGVRGLGQAVERAMEVSFSDFRAKVVAFLKPEDAALYSIKDNWDALQESVVETLQRAQQ